jgi:hypothetical protein
VDFEEVGGATTGDGGAGDDGNEVAGIHHPASTQDLRSAPEGGDRCRHGPELSPDGGGGVRRSPPGRTSLDE